MLLFSYTLRRYAPILAVVLLLAAVVTFVWLPQPLIVPFPQQGVIDRLEMLLPVLLTLPFSFLLHEKSTVELALLHGVSTVRLYLTHVLAVLVWVLVGAGVTLLLIRYEPLTAEVSAQAAVPIVIPQAYRLLMTASAAVTLLFFISLVLLIRVALRSCYVPIGLVLLSFTLFYEQSRSIRSGLAPLWRGLFDPFISGYLLGDSVPLSLGVGRLWTANRLLFLDLSLLFFVLSALILRRERMHE